ncbi:MAG: glycosyltransferase family 4 protein [candidate division Zixibacteria bacterium]|nr:glycosyltransferase family 4 protein [candidate division Zixibacteria bacterium]
MTIISNDKLNSFTPPPKDPGRLRIAVSNEFFELYRGDKDFRVGKILCRGYGCEIVCLGTNIASPADSQVFGSSAYAVDKVGELPDNFYHLLMKTRLIYHRKGNISLGGFFRWTPGIIRQLLRWKPDLILENPYLSLTPRSYMTFMASRLLNIPIVYLDAGDIMPQLTLKHKIVLPVEKRVVNKAATIITYNLEGKKRFINKYGYPGEKITVTPKPIDTSRYHPYLDCRSFSEKHGLDNKFVVAYYGRLCTNKGAKYLLEAADIMRRRGTDKDMMFFFVGGNIEADQATEFKDVVKKMSLENVRLTGMVPNKDMPVTYAAADIAVYPDVTNLPGFSTVLAESMAAGLPIIIGIKGWEDAVPIVDGENGLIIEHANPEQIADKIELLKGNHHLRRKLGENVLEFARQKMDYNKVVEKYYSIFNKLITKTVRIINNGPGIRRERETEKNIVR